MKTFLMAVGAITLIILAPVVYSFIQVQLWDWFVVPYLGFPHIGKAVMYGINLFISSFTLNHAKDKGSPWYVNILVMFLIWGLGGFVHHFLL